MDLVLAGVLVGTVLTVKNEDYLEFDPYLSQQLLLSLTMIFYKTNSPMLIPSIGLIARDLFYSSIFCLHAQLWFLPRELILLCAGYVGAMLKIRTFMLGFLKSMLTKEKPYAQHSISTLKIMPVCSPHSITTSITAQTTHATT